MICLNQFDQIMSSHRKIANLQGAIHLIRGQRVMLDFDLAMIYGVTTKRLNEQLKRNRLRFPADFAFQLTVQEFRTLKSQIATSSSHGGKRKLPWVFTEHGALMLASAEQRDRCPGKCSGCASVRQTAGDGRGQCAACCETRGTRAAFRFS
jgi:hypothetical protein